MRVVLVIDPGKNGGFAWRDGHGRTGCARMPKTEGDIVDFIRGITASSSDRVCYIEHVGGFCGEDQPGSSMFRFGRGVGVLNGALLAFGWRTIEVRPQTWQAGMGVGKASACASKCEWKNKLKAEAQRRFPAEKVTLMTADALLMLDYALQKEGN